MWGAGASVDLWLYVARTQDVISMHACSFIVYLIFFIITESLSEGLFYKGRS